MLKWPNNKPEPLLWSTLTQMTGAAFPGLVLALLLVPLDSFDTI